MNHMAAEPPNPVIKPSLTCEGILYDGSTNMDVFI